MVFEPILILPQPVVPQCETVHLLARMSPSPPSACTVSAHTDHTREQ